MTQKGPEPEPIKLLLERGYTKRKCVSCGNTYYSLDPAVDRCGDTPCVEYSFIGDPRIPGKYDIDSMREKYLSFFDKDHTRVERATVIPRWRDDVLLVNASIYVFQPHVTSGEVPAPANPLTISQPCIRMVDIDAVGRSGRHLSTFEMMAHHAFNYPNKEVYWKEGCVGYCDDLLRSLGVRMEGVTYIENPWTGGGNGGNALEVMVGGLELATLVFMDMRADPAGSVTIKGGTYSPMDIKIVDTGYGLERFLWCSNGAPTIYDCLWPDVIKKVKALVKKDIALDTNKEMWAETARLSGVMNVDTSSQVRELRKELAKRLNAKGFKLDAEELTRIMEPVESLYTIVDHARCLGLMLHDGMVPSNAKAGYLVRLVIRKTIRMMERLGIEADLADIVMMHTANLKGVASLKEKEPHIRRILELETERYRETASKAGKLVSRHKGELAKDAIGTLVKLYDSQGLHPDIVRKEAEALGLHIDVPDAFSALVAERHAEAKDDGASGPKVEAWLIKATNDVEKMGIPPTKLLYYEGPTTKEFQATVLYSHDHVVALDSTAFYPDGGGQPCDLGTIKGHKGEAEIATVQKVGSVVVHRLKGNPPAPKVGEVVEGRVDWPRRIAHMRHHTATHIVLGAIREVLGPHIWQAGAQKGADMARLDVTHYAKVTDEERWRIERLANEVVLKGLDIESLHLPREAAERKYGMRLYQGGPPAAKSIRVLRISDFDVQGCGGTHARNTADVGPIKILKVERVQDGVVRFEFAAGIAAVVAVQGMERLLGDASRELSVPPDQLPKSVKRFFEEWKCQRKEIETLRGAGVAQDVAAMAGKGDKVGDITIIAQKVDAARRDLPKLSLKATKEGGGRTIAIFISTGTDVGAFAIGRSDGVDIDCGEVAKQAASAVGGSGGGRPDFAQGAVKDASKVDALLEALKKGVRTRITR